MDRKISPFAKEIKRPLIASFIIVLVAIGAYFAFRPKKAPVDDTASKRIQIAAVTPQYFTSLAGTVTAVDLDAQTLTIDFFLVDATGKDSTKSYTIAIDKTTTLVAAPRSGSTESPNPIALTDIVIGDTINAVGETNLAPVDNFTATTIIKIIS